MTYSGPRLRSLALLATGVLALPALAACGGHAVAESSQATGPDIHRTARDQVREGSTLRWAVDTMPQTFNTFQADADATTARVASAVLPTMYTLDERGRPLRSADYLTSAKVVTTEPKQVVVYHLSQKAVWSNGREIGAPDFLAQWRALRGKDSAYWTARNAGYDRIEKIERGKNNLEVRVTFAQPYADWRALFSPLYPKEVMGTPDSFNDGARARLKVTAGPFGMGEVDRRAHRVNLTRNPRWWGASPKLDKVVLRQIDPDDRLEALAKDKVDLAGIEPADAERIALAHRDKGGNGPLAHGPGAAVGPAEALRSWAVAHGSQKKAAKAERKSRAVLLKARRAYAAEQRGLSRYQLRKTLEPAYTQLALNGESGPLSDERVRRAVARAIDRKALADLVLTPLGLPAKPVGSHLALAGQDAYADNSGALGDQDTAEAQALLADAGWTRGGAQKEQKEQKAAGSKADTDSGSDSKPAGTVAGEERAAPARPAAQAGTSFLLGPTPVHQQAALLQQAYALATGPQHSSAKHHHAADTAKDAKAAKSAKAAKAAETPVKLAAGAGAGAAGAYAPKGTAAPQPSAAAARGVPVALDKDGKPLTLRFVLPSGPGTESLRAVGERIGRMLEKIGIRTDISKVSEAGYFKDHVASGEYDMALYSWPGSAFPATDARPVYAKPVPAADGSLNVDQNYTRVGTDHIDQLLDQAAGTLDEGEARALVKKADARIWAAAGSIPLYQRPELVAARPDVVNAGAFGFATPVWQDLGFAEKKTAAHGSKGEHRPKSG